MKIGVDVLMVGLAVQLATFLVFFLIVGKFHRLVRGAKGIENVRAEAGEGWKRVLLAVEVSSGLIVVRSVYRLVEFAMGIHGYPFTHEWMFYVFESLPMFPAISVFCVWHQAGYFGSGKGKRGGGVLLESSDGMNA